MSITHRVRRLLVAGVAGAMVLSLMPAGVAAADEHDVCEGGPVVEFADADSIAEVHLDNVLCMAAYGITIGVDDVPNFAPGNNVTRQQMALFIARTATQTLFGNTDIPEAEEGPFTDLDQGVPAAQANAINWLFSLGITTGTTDTTYSPGDPVTRQAMASFIARAHEALGVFELVDVEQAIEDFEGEPFTDVDDIAEVHLDNVLALQALGVVTGFVDGSYGPGEPVTRQQMSAFIIRSVRILDELGLWNGRFIDPDTGEPIDPEVPETPETPVTPPVDPEEPEVPETPETPDVDVEFALALSADPETPVELTEVVFTADLDVNVEDESVEDVPVGLAIFGFTDDIEDALDEDGLVDTDAAVAYEEVDTDADGVAEFVVEDGLPAGEHLVVAWASEEAENIDPAEALDVAALVITVTPFTGIAITSQYQVALAGGDFIWISDGEAVSAFAATAADTYMVDGVASSKGAFQNAMTVGDEITVTADGDNNMFALTNIDTAEILEGVVQVVALTAVDGETIVQFIDPPSGVALRDVPAAIAAGQQYTVDGSPVNFGQFAGSLSTGDFLEAEVLAVDDPDDPTTWDFRHNLENRSVDGFVLSEASDDASITIDTNPDDVYSPNLASPTAVPGFDDDTFEGVKVEYVEDDVNNTYVVDGNEVGAASFTALVTAAFNQVDDAFDSGTLTFSKVGGNATYEFVRVPGTPPAPVTGVVVAGNSAAGVVVSDTNGVSVTIAFAAGESLTLQGPTAISDTFAITVDGVAATFAEFAGDLSLGDTLTYTAPFGPTNFAGAVALENGELTGRVIAYASETSPTIDIQIANGFVLGGVELNQNAAGADNPFGVLGSQLFTINGETKMITEVHNAFDGENFAVPNVQVTLDEGTNANYSWNFTGVPAGWLS